MIGPGKYDDLCTYVREQSKAHGAVVIILGGDNGNGFSVQGSAGLAAALPSILRQTADLLERDIERELPDHSPTKS